MTHGNALSISGCEIGLKYEMRSGKGRWVGKLKREHGRGASKREMVDRMRNGQASRAHAKWVADRVVRLTRLSFGQDWAVRLRRLRRTAPK